MEDGEAQVIAWVCRVAVMAFGDFAETWAYQVGLADREVDVDGIAAACVVVAA